MPAQKTTVRFNENQTKFGKLERFASSQFLNENSQNVTSNLLGIGLKNDETLVPPKLLKERKEMYKKIFYQDLNWGQKTQYAPLDNNNPEKFPMRESVDYLKLRKEAGLFSSGNRTPVKRLCQDYIEQHKNELHLKKDEVNNYKKEMTDRNDQARKYAYSVKREKRQAVIHDLNVAKTNIQAQEIIPKVIKVIKKITIKPRNTYKLNTYQAPYIIYDENNEADDEILFTGSKKVPMVNKNPTRTVLVKVGGGLDQCGQTDSFLFEDPNNRSNSNNNNNGINLYQMLKEITKSEQKVEQTPNPNISEPSIILPRKEIVILLPKVFGFNSMAPKEVTNSEFAENYQYFKVDAKLIEEYLVKNNVDPHENVSLEKVRDIVETLGLPLENEDQKLKYKKMLEKERLRKERIERQLTEKKEERELKNMESSEKKRKKFIEMQKEEQQKRAEIMNKQQEITNKMRNLSEEKLKEKSKKLIESESKRLLREKDRAIKEIRRDIENFIQKKIIKPIIDTAYNEIKSKLQEKSPRNINAEDTKSNIYVTKESHYPNNEKQTNSGITNVFDAFRDHNSVPDSNMPDEYARQDISQQMSKEYITSSEISQDIRAQRDAMTKKNSIQKQPSISNPTLMNDDNNLNIRNTEILLPKNIDNQLIKNIDSPKAKNLDTPTTKNNTTPHIKNSEIPLVKNSDSIKKPPIQSSNDKNRNKSNKVTPKLSQKGSSNSNEKSRKSISQSPIAQEISNSNQDNNEDYLESENEISKNPHFAEELQIVPEDKALTGAEQKSIIKSKKGKKKKSIVQASESAKSNEKSTPDQSVKNIKESSSLPASLKKSKKLSKNIETPDQNLAENYLVDDPQEIEEPMTINENSVSRATEIKNSPSIKSKKNSVESPSSKKSKQQSTGGFDKKRSSAQDNINETSKKQSPSGSLSPSRRNSSKINKFDSNNQDKSQQISDKSSKKTSSHENSINPENKAARRARRMQMSMVSGLISPNLSQTPNIEETVFLLSS